VRVNRQVAVLQRGGKRVVKQRVWRTFGGKPVSRAGRFRKWGVIEELHEDDKIMCDFDDPEAINENVKGHRKRRSRASRNRRVGRRLLWLPGGRRTSTRNERSNHKRRDRPTVRSIPCPPVQSLAHTLGLKVVWQRWDKTKHGWHLIIKIRQRLTLAEVIAAQAILGSDRSRERLNLARAISIRLRPSKFWKARANILYKRKIK